VIYAYKQAAFNLLLIWQPGLKPIRPSYPDTNLKRTFRSLEGNPSLKSSIFPPIPEDTSHAAHSIFNIENVYLRIGDQVEDLFAELNLADLDISGIKRAEKLSLLAMVTIFQYAENLPDRLAIEALQTRMDWKYALHLSLVTPGLDQLALCEFRQGLLDDSTGQQVFQLLLARLGQLGLFSSRVRGLIDTCSVLLTVCTHSRVDQLWQSISLALEALAADQPEFLRRTAPPHWYERYQSSPTTASRSSADQMELGKAIGKDIHDLLEALQEAGESEIAELVEIQNLRKVSGQHFTKRASWREYCSFCRGVNSKPPTNQIWRS
jgi:transposase